MYDVRNVHPPLDAGPPEPPPRPKGSLFPVLVVVGFGLAMTIGLVALTGAAGLFVVLALAGVFGFAALHYVLWGWWLAKRIREEQQAEE